MRCIYKKRDGRTKSRTHGQTDGPTLVRYDYTHLFKEKADISTTSEADQAEIPRSMISQWYQNEQDKTHTPLT